MFTEFFLINSTRSELIEQSLDAFFSFAGGKACSYWLCFTTYLVKFFYLVLQILLLISCVIIAVRTADKTLLN